MILAENLETPTTCAHIFQSLRNLCALGVSALDFSPSKSFPFSVFLAELCFSVTLLEATLTKPSASVHSKRLTQRLNPLECALTKNRGAGGYYC
jgi:hypothetical protein